MFLGGNMHSKTLILSSLKQYPSNTPRAIVTLIQNQNNILGKIRLYNQKPLDDSVKMGIYIDGEVKTMEITRKFDSYEFIVDEKLNLEQDVYCALVDVAKNNEVVLCGGSYAGYFATKETTTEIYTPKIDSDEEKANENKIDKLKLGDKETETLTCPNCDCTKCEYKKYFYEHASKKNEQENNLDNIKNTPEQELAQNETYTDFIDSSNLTAGVESANFSSPQQLVEEVTNLTSNNSQEIIDEKTVSAENNKTTSSDTVNQTESFLSQITEQLDEMFNRYPLDETIMKIIPNSKIIKVTDSVDGNPYILGVMYENNAIKYLVYGVPSNYNQKAPSELGDNYNWLPLDADNPYQDGYYLIYQDASNGKIVPIKVE